LTVIFLGNFQFGRAQSLNGLAGWPLAAMVRI
jgi:hypothetical protein